jgi:primosomal protein N' (replication factor Y)
MLGRQAIVLVPEIALTPQTVRRFLSRFPGQVGLVHSLSQGERYDTWRRARAGMLNVIVGPQRLFAPLKNLGLIVVDEFHDDLTINPIHTILSHP